MKQLNGWRMSCDVGKRRKGCRMNCDVGEVMETLENERCSFALPTSQLIVQPFRRFTYVTTHSPTLPSFTYVTAHSPTPLLLHLRHSSFSNPSVVSLTSQAHSPTLLSLLLRHRLFIYVIWRVPMKYS